MKHCALALLTIATCTFGTCTKVPAFPGRSASCCDPVDSLLFAAIAESRFPAAAVAVGSARDVVKSTGYGTFTYSDSTAVTDTTLFDLASLTKVIATTTSLMVLHERGLIDLDLPVATYLPDFGANGKADVTIRNLLQHRGGLVPFRRFYLDPVATRGSVIDAVLQDSLNYVPDTKEVYSDLGFISLGLLVETVAGVDLAAFTRANVFEPLGMTQTGFRSAGYPSDFIVPTEVDSTFRMRLVQGEVHDENAYVLGGIAGHAGLFSSAADLARFAQMMAGRGMLEGKRFLNAETIATFTDRAMFPDGRRALGWDFKSLEGYSSAGQRFGPQSYGHTGFTGTSIWIDPEASVFAILLTNRVYPTRANRGHIDIRPAFADRAFALVEDR